MWLSCKFHWHPNGAIRGWVGAALVLRLVRGCFLATFREQPPDNSRGLCKVLRSASLSDSRGLQSLPVPNAAGSVHFSIRSPILVLGCRGQ